MSVPADHLIAYYSLDDVTDAHTGGYDMTNVNSATFVTGKVGNGVDCDVTNQSGLVLTNASAGAFQFGTESRAVSLWVYVNNLPTSGNAGSLVVMGATGAGDAGFHVIFNNSGGSGQIVARFSDGTTLYTASSAATLSATTWYHVVVSYYRPGSMTVTINNVVAANTSIAASVEANVSSDDDLKIGGRYASQVWIDAIIDEVAFFDEPMSADIIDWLYNAGSGRSYADLVAFNRPWVRSRWSTEQTTNTTSISSPVALMKDGDWIIHQVSIDGAPTSVAITQTGFTNQVTSAPGGTVTVNVWTKQITSDEEHSTLGITWVNSERATSTTIILANASAIDVVDQMDNTTTGTPDAPDVVTTVDDAYIVVGIGTDNNGAFSVIDSDLYTHVDLAATQTASTHSYIGRQIATTAGTYGPWDFTISSGTPNSVGWAIAFAPVSTGATGQATLSDEIGGYVIAAKTGGGSATLSDEVSGYITGAVGAKIGTGYATLSDEITGYVQGIKLGAGSATMSDGFVSYTVYAKIGAASVTLSDEATGYTAYGTIRSGVVTLSDEVVGYIIGGTNVIPSQIALSIAHLHKIGLTLSNINKITLTIDRI